MITGEALHGTVERGRAGETIAALHLRLRGYAILDHNRRAGGGEVDLIARDGPCLVFVEVRLRRAGQWVGAAGSIGATKRRRLRAAAAALLRAQEVPSWPERTLRFDVVTLTVDGERTEVDLLRGVRL